MNAQQKVYVAARIAGMTARAAADEAGYEHPPRGKAVRQAISEGITHKLETLGIKGEDVVRRLAQIAFADVTDVVQVEESESGQFYEKKETKDGPVMEPVGSNRVVITATEMWGEQHRAAVHKIKQGRDGIEVAFSDQVKALEILAKHFGLFEEQTKIHADNLIVVPAKNGDVDDWQKQAEAARELSLARMQAKIG